MIVIPAIDIAGGQVVRLEQGKFEKKTVYGKNPAQTASAFAKAGATRIHVVDLEGARSGSPRERSSIVKLIQEVNCEFQVGGGIRNTEDVEEYLNYGAKRVVLGTRASLDKGFLKEVLDTFSDSVIIAIDAVDGKCATHGWTKITDVTVDKLAQRVQELKGEEILYTDISKDGMMQGVNTEALSRLLDSTVLKLIASGGVSSLEDIRVLRELKAERLLGVITGRALYEGKFDLKEAIELVHHAG